jgi:hypothetical protein
MLVLWILTGTPHERICEMPAGDTQRRLSSPRLSRFEWVPAGCNAGPRSGSLEAPVARSLRSGVVLAMALELPGAEDSISAD